MMTSPTDWEWFGLSGHFIYAYRCRFHLCTKVGPWLVSTVGQYVPSYKPDSPDMTDEEWLEANWLSEGSDDVTETG